MVAVSVAALADYGTRCRTWRWLSDGISAESLNRFFDISPNSMVLGETLIVRK
jgi:hypothetical protein